MMCTTLLPWSIKTHTRYDHMVGLSFTYLRHLPWLEVEVNIPTHVLMKIMPVPSAKPITFRDHKHRSGTSGESRGP
jgi:hypothetical protein